MAQPGADCAKRNLCAPLPALRGARPPPCHSSCHVRCPCSGKSSRVPQFLLEDLGGGPVLCTQPRRLAVVSIARRVAEERGVPLGGDEVGYRIGQRPHYTSRTAIVFATAGVLLEDLKGEGLGLGSKTCSAAGPAVTGRPRWDS